MMQVEVTVVSARDLKNVNWRHGELKAYAVLWVNDDGPKCSTRVDLDNGENPVWEEDGEKVIVPVPPSAADRMDDAVLFIDVVHAANAGEEDDVKPLVGSARLPLRDVLDDAGAGIGGGKQVSRTLRLKRPSGRPQGRIDVRVAVSNPRYLYDGGAYPNPAPAYPAANPRYSYGSRDPYYNQYEQQPPAAGYGGYYGDAAPPPVTTAPPVGDPNSSQTTTANSNKSKMGMGTGLAVGAAAGVLGGLALAGGASYLEDKFEENVA